MLEEKGGLEEERFYPMLINLKGTLYPISGCNLGIVREWLGMEVNIS